MSRIDGRMGHCRSRSEPLTWRVLVERHSTLHGGMADDTPAVGEGKDRFE
jgi:hypothetical protein